MRNDYYTYAYLREDGTPYYVGRGTGRRAYRKHSNIATPPKNRILFLKTGLTFSESCKHECYMIAVLGFKANGGLLHNRTLGGEGSEFHRLTPEQAEKKRKSLTGRTLSQKHRENLSKAMKGKPWSEEEREKRLKGYEARETHSTSVLTKTQKREIASRFLPKSTEVPGNANLLSEEFGVSADHIRRVARDPRWTS